MNLEHPVVPKATKLYGGRKKPKLKGVAKAVAQVMGKPLVLSMDDSGFDPQHHMHPAPRALHPSVALSTAGPLS